MDKAIITKRELYKIINDLPINSSINSIDEDGDEGYNDYLKVGYHTYSERIHNIDDCTIIDVIDDLYVETTTPPYTGIIIRDNTGKIVLHYKPDTVVVADDDIKDIAKDVSNIFISKAITDLINAYTSIVPNKHINVQWSHNGYTMVFGTTKYHTNNNLNVITAITALINDAIGGKPNE